VSKKEDWRRIKKERNNEEIDQQNVKKGLFLLR
jgi:hypothetical protein